MIPDSAALKLFEKPEAFKTLFEYAAIGILVVDSKGKIELANPYVANMFGYEVNELEGQTLEILLPVNLRKIHENHRQDYFQHPKSRPMGEGIALSGLKKNGEEIPVEISLGYFVLSNEHKAMAFVTDITERKKYSESLEEKVRVRTLELTSMLEREQELNEIKSRFVSMASHEFRTPLGAILSSVSLVESYIENNDVEKRSKHIGRIKSSVKNLTDILNNFLSLDRLNEGKIEMFKESFDFREYAQDLNEDMRALIKKGQEIKCEFNGDTQVFQDKRILRSVLMNLISNAIKYSQENKTIRFVYTRMGNTAKIEVIDQGIGIPDADKKNLFGTFFRAANVTNIQGTGLGLNIIKRYLELINGQISFESELNKGTTFTIEFPVIETQK